MLTDIAAALPYQTILFDYNQYDESTNTLTVAPLTEQAKKLYEVITRVRTKNPDATIDLICHSQGCVVVGLAQPTGLRKIILLAPPARLNAEQMIRIFGSRPGTHLDLAGISSFPRRDGSTTLVPKAYWTSIKNVDPISLFNQLAGQVTVSLIQANQDEVIGGAGFSKLTPAIEIISIDANHDFTGPAREQLIKVINQEMA